MATKDPSTLPTAFTIKTSHYIIAGMSLVAALSWNEAIKHFIKSIYVLPNDVTLGNLLYAIIITVVLIIVIYLLPDTKSELPIDTPAKIDHVEDQQAIRKVQEQLQIVRAQNEFLLSNVR